MSIKLVRLFTRGNFDAEIIIGSEEITTLKYFGNQKEFHLNTINTSSIYTPSGQQKSASLNGDAIEDTSAPELANLSVSFDYVESGTDILNVGDTLVVGYQFVDQTGLDFLTVTWISENRFEITEGGGTSFMLGDDYVSGLEILSTFPKERYEAQKLNLIDPLGNSVDYFRDGVITGASVLTAHEFDLSILDFEIIS